MNIFDLDLDLSETHVESKHKSLKRYLFSYLDDKTVSFQIDNSSLEVNNTCPRSAEYKLVHARSSLPSSALTAGSAIHEGLETYYKGLAVHGRSDELIERAILASAKPFLDRPPAFMDWRSPDRVVDTLEKYFREYQSEPFTIRQDSEGLPAVEMSFSLPLGVVEFGGVKTIYTKGQLIGNLPANVDPNEPFVLHDVQVYWTGKCDLAITLDHQPWVMDHKTCSMMGKTFWDNFQMSNQTVGYTWAAEKIFGEPFTGLLVNALYWRPPTAKGIMTTEFHRQRFYYDPQQVKEWELNVHATINDFLSHLARGYFPMYTAWCQGKYGQCPYFGTCSMPSQFRMSDLLTSFNYTDTEWSPLAE